MKATRLDRFAQAFFFALSLAAAGLAAAADNRSDIWWNPAEAGRGLIVIDHETDLFLVWCTYSDFGLPIWQVVPGGNLSADRRTFEGSIYQTFSNGDDLRASVVTLLGTATIDFAPVDLAQGSARYSIRYGSGPDAVVETHELVRQAFGTAAPAWGADATDLWWDPQEPGWAIATIQHGRDDIFGVLITYTYSGGPAFYVFPSQRETEENSVFLPVDNEFDGTMYQTRVPAGNGTFVPGAVSVAKLGTLSMRLVAQPPGPATRLDFSMDNFTHMRRLVRQPFGKPLPGNAQ